jgi:hypothetical protein
LNHSDAVVHVNQYELRTDRESFVAVISALAERTGTQGHPGVNDEAWVANAGLSFTHSPISVASFQRPGIGVATW